jgi:hypothetical protein
MVSNHLSAQTASWVSSFAFTFSEDILAISVS